MEGSNEIWAAPLSDYRIAVLVLLLGRRNRHKTAGPPPPARHLRRHPRQEQETQGNEGEEESSALTDEKAVERMAPSKLCRAVASRTVSRVVSSAAPASRSHRQASIRRGGGDRFRAVEEVDWPKPGPFPIRATQNERYFQSRPGLKLDHFDPAGTEDVPGRSGRYQTRP